MVKLFVYLESSYSRKRFIPLVSELNGVNFFFYHDVATLKDALTQVQPDALLLHSPDLKILLNEKEKIQGKKLRIIVVGHPKPGNRIFASGTDWLGEDFTCRELSDLLHEAGDYQTESVFPFGKFKSHIDKLPIALFWKDVNLKYLGCNRQFCIDRGLTDQETIVGLTDYDLFPKEIAGRNIQQDRELLQSGHEVINFVEQIVRDDGRIDYFRKTEVTVQDDAGKVVAIMGYFVNITEPTLMEKHLKKEKQYLQMLMDHIPDTIYIKDRQSRFIKINKAEAKLLGIEDPEKAVGLSDSDFFDPDHAFQAYVDEQELMQNKRSLIKKLEYVKTPEGYRFVEATKSPILDEQGNCIGVVGISRDVTNEHLAEEKLRQEKELMNLLMDNVPDRIYFKDKESRFIRVNKAMVHSFGKESADEVHGKTDFDFHDPDLAKLAYADEQELMRRGEPLINRMECHHKKGKKTWVSATKIPLFNQKNELIGMVGISRDYTKQKQLEEALEHEKELLQILMDNVPDFIYFKDADLKMTRVNKAVTESLGMDFSQIIGKRDHDLFEKEYADVFLANEQKILESGQPMVNVIEKTVFKDGSVGWLSTTKVPVWDMNGQICGLAGISRDITSQELIRQQQKEAKERAEEANRAKSLFLANMSHEIRTPMNGVIGMADILRRTNLDQEQKEYLDIIMKSGQNLLSIINDILDFSKIESGKMELESAPINIRNIVEEVADVQVFQANEKSVDLITFVDAAVPEVVNGDYVRLKQVITNLVNNAIKFTRHGEVLVSAVYGKKVENKHEIVFKVKDTGIGIAKNNQDKLFRSFSQVDTSTTRKFGGTGLGLAICHRLVSEMGGAFTLESEEGKGSEFSFTALFEEGETHSDNILLNAVPFTNLNVLVVDDNKTNRRIFREYMKSWGMNVYEAENGKDALTVLSRLKDEGTEIGIALLDFQMAEMDGLELANKIKAEPRLSSTRLVLLSSATDAIPRDKLKDFGFDHYLNKPVKLHQLFNILAAIVGKPKRTTPDGHRDDLIQLGLADKHFLIVEDNEINLKVAQFSLKSVSPNVYTAVNGLEAVEIFKSRKIDYILMDIQMPVMNGIEATIQIREFERQQNVTNPVRIISMTANTMREDVEECLKIGMDAFMGKPFRVSDMVSILSELSN